MEDQQDMVVRVLTTIAGPAVPPVYKLFMAPWPWAPFLTAFFTPPFFKVLATRPSWNAWCGMYLAVATTEILSQTCTPKGASLGPFFVQWMPTTVFGCLRNVRVFGILIHGFESTSELTVCCSLLFSNDFLLFFDVRKGVPRDVILCFGFP